MTLAPMYVYGGPRTQKELSSSEQPLQICLDLVNTVA